MKKKIIRLLDKARNTKIYQEIILHFFVKEDPELAELRKELEYTRNRLEAARSNFDYAKDDAMIEYYTYIMMANEIKYGYLTRKYQELKEAKAYADDLTIIPEELKERRAL